jgi:hypothetical protein
MIETGIRRKVAKITLVRTKGDVYVST